MSRKKKAKKTGKETARFTFIRTGRKILAIVYTKGGKHYYHMFRERPEIIAGRKTIQIPFKKVKYNHKDGFLN